MNLLHHKIYPTNEHPNHEDNLTRNSAQPMMTLDDFGYRELAEQSNKDNAGKPAHFPTIEVVYDYDVDTYAGNTYTFGDVEQV